MLYFEPFKWVLVKAVNFILVLKALIMDRNLDKERSNVMRSVKRHQLNNRFRRTYFKVR
jgi:hypothetical protein